MNSSHKRTSTTGANHIIELPSFPKITYDPGKKKSTIFEVQKLLDRNEKPLRSVSLHEPNIFSHWCHE
jgi:hypothetical protein